MKTLLKDYTFSAAGKTVTFTNYSAINLERILAVINVTRAATYFQMGSSTLTGTVATNVLTLGAGVSTSGHADTDKLAIFYDDSAAIDNIPGQNPLRPAAVGGKAVASLTYGPAYTADDAAALALDKDNGGLLVNQGDLNVSYDSVGAAAIGTADPNLTGLGYFRSITVNSTAQNIKASPGNLYGLRITNKDTGIIYVKFYNKAGATSTDTPFITVAVAATAGSYKDMNFLVGRKFDVACSVRCVSDVADSGTTVPATLPIIEVDYL